MTNKSELRTAKTLFLISAIVYFIIASISILAGILGMTQSALPILKPVGVGGIVIGALIGISGGIEIWCRKLVEEERKLSTAGIWGIVIGILFGVIGFFSGILLILPLVLLVPAGMSLIAGITIMSNKEKTKKK